MMSAKELQPPRGFEEITRVLVISTNRLDRDCTRAELSRAEGMHVEACDEPASYHGLGVPDVIVLQDPHSAPDPSWLSSQLRLIGTHWASAHVIAVGSQSEASLDICLEARVRAYLPRESTPNEVVAAIRLTLTGLLLYPASLLDRIGTLVRGSGTDRAPSATGARTPSNSLARFTARQTDVLRLVAIGLSNKEIARSLSISESTAKVHVRAIMKRMGVSNRAQMLARFIAARSVSEGWEP